MMNTTPVTSDHRIIRQFDPKFNIANSIIKLTITPASDEMKQHHGFKIFGLAMTILLAMMKLRLNNVIRRMVNTIST
jgi:hypothetical protein